VFLKFGCCSAVIRMHICCLGSWHWFYVIWFAHSDSEDLCWFSARVEMQSIRNSILSHIRLRGSAEQFLFAQRGNVFKQLHRQMCTSVGTSPDKIMDRVIGLVKKFDKIDATKVTNWRLPWNFLCFLCFLSILWLFEVEVLPLLSIWLNLHSDINLMVRWYFMSKKEIFFLISTSNHSVRC